MSNKNDLLSRALITGAHGMVGSYIDFGLRTGRADFDITDLDTIRRVCGEINPSIIIHLAAETDLKKCQDDPARAYMVNSIGTYHVALAARDAGALMVYVSTASVFDGKKETPYVAENMPAPRHAYGHSKYAGELATALVPDHLIVRTGWLFGGGPGKDHKFVSKILRQREEPNLSVVADVKGSPTYAKDLVRGIRELITQGKRGVAHMCNEGVASRADIAREVLTIAGSSAQVRDVSQAAFGGVSFDGVNEGMIPSLPMRPWQEALREYLKTEWSENL